MATAYTYPGVYIKEAAGIGSIVGVSTSDTVFIDFFAQGPVQTATRITSMDNFNRLFGGLDQRSEASYAIQQFFLNGGTVAWVVRVLDSAAKATTISIPFGTATITATAASAGAWGNQFQIGFDNNFPLASGGTAPTTVFNMVIQRVNTAGTVLAREVYRGLVSDPASAQSILSVVNNASSLVVLSGTLTAGLAPTTLNTNIINPAPSATLKWSTGTNGSDGSAPPSDGTAWTAGVTPMTTGLGALDKMAPYTFSLMCIPAAANLTTKDQATVYAAALSYCQTYMAFLLVNIGKGTSSYANGASDFVNNWYADTNIQTILANPTADHAAVYYPRLRIPDPLNSYNPRSVASSGTIAGIYARTDSNRGVWKAPAGTEAGLVNATVNADGQGRLLNLNDQDNGALNPFGLNALRTFPIFGTVVWGARTLRGADAAMSIWKYVPVRRLALYLEQSLFQGSKWIVFEPNDEPLWAEIRKTFTAFMQSLFLQGAFQGKSPADAYFVRCDSSTTTQNDIDNGIVNILVGFAPLMPAEFVVITIQQIAGQAGA